MTRARDLSQVLNDVGSISTNDIANGAVTQVKLDPSISLGVRVSSVAYPGDDTAADTAGGQTITINGAGFAATPTVYIDNTIAPSVSFVSSTQITFTTPAKTAGTYNLFVINPDGSTAIHVMGISYSGTPTWTTPAGSLGTQNAASISVQLIATGDTPLVYSLTSGSTLPAGVTLSSSGLISGTLGTAQTFSFSVDVTDPQYQTTPRSFSLTVSVGEPYFQYVTLLLSGNQPSGVTDTDNKTFKDSSANNFAISRASNTTQGTFSPFSKVNGRWGNYFDASGDYLSCSQTTPFSFGTGDFCIEAFLNITQNQGAGIWYPIFDSRPQNSTNGAYPILGFADGTKYVLAGPSSGVTTSTYAAVNNTWMHVVWTRVSGVSRVFVDGVLRIYNGSDSTNYIVGANGIRIGAEGFNSIPNSTWPGYMSNYRVIKGSIPSLYSTSATSVGTSVFTPPTAPLTAIANTSLLTCQSNRFIDNSTNAFAITRNGDVAVTTFSPFPTLTAYAAGTNGGSGYFDGSGDYLSFAADTAFAFGTGDYTVEAWVYFTSITTTDLQIIFMSGSTGGNNFYFHVDGNQISVGTTAAFVSNQATTFTTNQWYHIAACRSGTTLKLFVNGTQAGSNATDSTNWISSGTARVGSNEATTQLVNGYMSGVRVLKGTAQYTSNFTVPTAPLTAITNTSLLLSGTNGGIIDTSMSNDLETAGNTQISTAQSKWGGSSIYFDGNGDYLFARYNKLFGLLDDQGDFTLEGWFYRTVVGTGQFLLSTQEYTGTYTGWALLFNNTNTVGFFCYDSGNTPQSITSTATVGLNTWTHVAVSRSGGTTRLFVNGVVEATRTVAFANTVTQSPLVFGLRPEFGDSLYTGYMQDVRITFGYARYTANFTPPTGPFIGNGV